MDRNYNDKEIISRILVGAKTRHDEALRYLYKTYYPFIRGFVIKNNGDEEGAADVFQEAIVVLYNKIKAETFRGDSTIKTFLYAIARNLWLKELRKHPRQVSDITDLDNFTDFEAEESDEIENEQKGQLLRESISQLGEACREILIDYYYAKYSMKEIMVKLGLGSEQSTKNKKYRCMQQLIKLCRQNGLNKD